MPTTAPSPAAGPSVLVLRDGRVESLHHVAFAVTDAAGRLIHGGGDLARPIFPRSAIKPLQALPLVESGAADRFALDDREIALACASHAGEPSHVSAVRRWLGRLELGPDALECGAHPPQHGPSAEQLVRKEKPPCPLHNNCSGKHAGMLTLARHLGVATAGYTAFDHPVQARIAQTLADMAGVAALPEPGIDGCSAPNWPLPLPALAVAMARLGAPQAAGVPPARARACTRIGRAIRARPEMIAGTGRSNTLILQALPGVLAKAGAEGVYMAALPGEGLGLALKVADGAGRAAPVALLALLEALGVVDAAARDALAEVAQPQLHNHAGRVVGELRAAPGWPPLKAAGAFP